MSDTTHEDAYLRAQHFQTINELVYSSQQPLLDDSNSYLKMVQRGQISSTLPNSNLSRPELPDMVSLNYGVKENSNISFKFGFYSGINTGLNSGNDSTIGKDLGYKASSLVNYLH